LRPVGVRGAFVPMIHVPTAPIAHLGFDLLAWASGAAISVGLYRWRLKAAASEIAAKTDGGYFVALVLGAAPGAWLAGSANSLREHAPALSHSVAGALMGAIIGVEVYKALRGVKGSTGGVFVGSFALGLVIGRLGCFFAGLADDTFGSPTGLPWAVDLGDGIGAWAMRRGFYVLCLWYGAQRFVWEFLKPYPRLIGPFNLFHLLCAGLVAYGWIYYRADRARERDAQDRALSVSGPDHQPVRDLS
jgi:phosphatidylglycerol---prolipoprotein diacylglyceryl transferase